MHLKGVYTNMIFVYDNYNKSFYKQLLLKAFMRLQLKL